MGSGVIQNLSTFSGDVGQAAWQVVADLIFNLGPTGSGAGVAISSTGVAISSILP